MIASAMNSKQASMDEISGIFEDTSVKEDGVYLFTTATCPNCKIAKEYLKGINYDIIDAEKHPELVSEFAIMQAPTLIVIKDGEISKYANVSNIRKFADEQKALV